MACFPQVSRAVLAVSAVMAAVLSHSAQAQTVVRIGHVGPVSGPQAHYGRDNENGARMAVEELNAQGVTIAGKKVRFELIAEDDAADPKQGTAAAQKLCDAKVNGVVGHLNSGTTIPAAKVYSQCGLPMVTPSATNPELTQLGYKNVYRLLANDNALGAGLAQHASQVLKVKKVAIIDDRTAYGKGVADVFAKTAKSLGIEVVSQQYTNDKAVDFMAILTAIKSRKPDGIFFGGMDPQAGPMLRQMQQLHEGSEPELTLAEIAALKLQSQGMRLRQIGIELGITEIGCMAHARRKFFDLHAANKSQLAEQALHSIGGLYEVERQARGMGDEERWRIRQEKAAPIADALHTWMTAQRQLVPEGSAIAKALDYSLKRWIALTRYLDDGAVPIDNNWCENQIRPWALGRSNWLFAGSLRSGKRAAAIMSLIQSTRLNGYDPYAYLKDVLTRLPTQRNSMIAELLPHRWRPTAI